MLLLQNPEIKIARNMPGFDPEKLPVNDKYTFKFICDIFVAAEIFLNPEWPNPVSSIKKIYR